MYKRHYRLLISLMLVLAACKKETATDFVELDLLSYGMPIVIKAPSDPEIKTMDLVLSKDITVTKGKDFNLQIFESDADTRDIGAIKSRLLNEVRNNPYFDTILADNKAGFIYRSQIDSTYTNYGFRYIRIQSDKEYVFQQGLRGKFTEADVERMYQAVQ